ncbi:MAG: MBL fold metallo-hydrolase [Halobacteriaceae archaeon]
MDVRFLGGVAEVGRSALLIDDALLIDFGIKSGTPPRLPIEEPRPDAVVVSHAHLDHAGAVPALLSGQTQPPIHWTPPTRDLAIRLARDTLKLHGGTIHCPFTQEEIHRLTEASVTHGYRTSFRAAGYEVTFYDAGHIPGSAHVLVDDGDTRLLYTADFHTDSQRLVSGTDARPEADVVVTESTYAATSHQTRARVEDAFVESVTQTLWEGGTVIVPAFAIGRTQELLLVCAAHDIDCFVDGMGVEITETLLGHPEYLRDAEAMEAAKRHGRIVDGTGGQRNRIAGEPTVIITTSGMLSGGPAQTYVPLVRGNPTNKITLTGHQVEGSPGRRLLESGRAEFDGQIMPVAAQVEAYDFSAHADREGLLSFLGDYRDARVLVTHGDRCPWFAEELRGRGFEASAPAVGDIESL